jgi:hypothetical protein
MSKPKHEILKLLKKITTDELTRMSWMTKIWVDKNLG